MLYIKDAALGLVRRLLKIDFVRFCLVGTLGFLVSFSLLKFFTLIVGLHSTAAYIIGSEVSLFGNFLLHHHWTYKSRGVEKAILTLLVQFHVTSWVALVGGTAVFAVATQVFKVADTLALVISSGLGLFWNFAWSKFVIWRKRSTLPSSGG